MYGLKERAIAKILIQVLAIKGSSDAQGLLNWKLPLKGLGIEGNGKAGDFPGRVFDVVSRRAMILDPGKMTIDEVNESLDQLSKESKFKGYLPIFKHFYRHMCAEEIAWVVRIILRQMKIGASEKTLFDLWHKDALALFKVSSSLRRVCWEEELWNHEKVTRLAENKKVVMPMQCFQPQLAQYQMHDFAKMANRVRPSKEDPVFWIEEKLDGERLQMHMIPDKNLEGGRRFRFWSRNAKEYTYLYGNGVFAEHGSLTRYLEDVFNEGVQSLILDGEMITWDPLLKGMAPFGTLKTAALSEQNNPKNTLNQRPCYRVFDILYLNGMDLTRYALRDRRDALGQALANPIEGRIEIHKYQEAKSGEEIETALREIVARASEGLVLKNPFSVYTLNERTDDWLKVKPEYMTEYGEQLDVVIIGGYYGEGYRGGWFSSFLCGLKIDENRVRRGENPMKFISFFRVGGGFTVTDYNRIHKLTDGKWEKWDNTNKPPHDYVELGIKDHYRPDEWIKAKDSVVISVKAASITQTEKFAAGMSLRFPRYVSLREDKDWESALTKQEFLDLKHKVDKEKQMKIDKTREKRKRTVKKKPLAVLGRDNSFDVAYAGPKTKCFEGLTFYIMGGSTKPVRKSKMELEQLVTENAGEIVQTYDRRKIKEDKRRKVKEEGESSGLDDLVKQEEEEATEKAEDERLNRLICIADANLVQVNALKKRGGKSIIRPSWLFDMIAQSEKESNRKRLYRVPFEPKHFLYADGEDGEKAEDSVDLRGDSFARDTNVEDLRKLLDEMLVPKGKLRSSVAMKALASNEEDMPALSSWIFKGLVIAFIGIQDDEFDLLDSATVKAFQARRYARFMSASVKDDLEEGRTTHVVVCERDEQASRDRAAEIRREISTWSKLPRIVGRDWVESCWRENTRIDEERFAVV